MSIFAWLGEAFSPGPVGRIGLGRPPKRIRSRFIVLIRFAAAVTLLFLFLWYVLFDQYSRIDSDTLLLLIALLVYLAVGYFVHPKAATSNMGWLGGLIDNPFRLSDNVNRWLVLLELLLLPGRFISTSLVDFVILLVNLRR